MRRLGDHPVVEVAARHGQGNAARLDFAEAHPQFDPWWTPVRRSGTRGFRRAPGRTSGAAARSGPSQRGGPWISSIIVMPRACMRAYSSSMSSTRGVRWLMCVVRNAADVGGDGGDCLKLFVPVVVHGLPGELKGRGGQLQKRGRRRPRAGRHSALALSARASSSAPNSCRAPMNASSCARSSRQRTAVLGGQHGGEDTERILGQFIAVDRAEGRGDHGHGA